MMRTAHLQQFPHGGMNGSGDMRAVGGRSQPSDPLPNPVLGNQQTETKKKKKKRWYWPPKQKKSVIDVTIPLEVFIFILSPWTTVPSRPPKLANVPAKTPVSILQEILSLRGTTPNYELVQIKGAIHEPTFRCRVTVEEYAALGFGRSKKKAKHAAAKNVLDKIVGNPVKDEGPAIEDDATPLPATTFVDKIPGNPIGTLQVLVQALEAKAKKKAKHAAAKNVLDKIVGNPVKDEGPAIEDDATPLPATTFVDKIPGNPIGTLQLSIDQRGEKMAESGGGDGNPPKKSEPREEKIRAVRERQAEERLRRLEELKKQALEAQFLREQKEAERRKRMDELRVKENERRTQVLVLCCAVRERQAEERLRRLEELKKQALEAQFLREQKEAERRKRMDELRVKENERRTQELCVSRHWPRPRYSLIAEEGLPHERLFTITCTVHKHKQVGSGKSKKLAKRQAAQKMWELLANIPRNPIGTLQELCVSRHWPRPRYSLIAEEGLPHERLFTITCTVHKHKQVGSGGSKKIAKRQAAQKMWELLSFE